MPYPLPTFNINVNVWHYGSDTSGDPDLTFPANLAWGRRTHNGGEPDNYAPFVVLLCDIDTDIRGEWNTDGAFDIVEAAAGDGWWYKCLYVDRAGYQFSNQHKNCVLQLFRGNTPPAPGDMPVIGGSSCSDAVLLEYTETTNVLVPAGTGSKWFIVHTTTAAERHISLTTTTGLPGGTIDIYLGNNCETKLFQFTEPADAAWCFSWSPGIDVLEWYIVIPQDPDSDRHYTFEVADGPCGGGGGGGGSGDTLTTESGDTLVDESGNTLIT